MSLTGGELPAMMMIDCISRLVRIAEQQCGLAEFETFHDNLLSIRSTRARKCSWGKKCRISLLSGHHANVEMAQESSRSSAH